MIQTPSASPAIQAIRADRNSDSSASAIPKLLFSEDISLLTNRSISTIRHYTGNAKDFGHLLPKWFKLPGSRRLAWLESDVMAWIIAGQTPVVKAKRRRGRPTKAEQLARRDSATILAERLGLLEIDATLTCAGQPERKA